jgi:predicted transcriptional regulator
MKPEDRYLLGLVFEWESEAYIDILKFLKNNDKQRSTKIFRALQDKHNVSTISRVLDKLTITGIIKREYISRKEIYYLLTFDYNPKLFLTKSEILDLLLEGDFEE